MWTGQFRMLACGGLRHCVLFLNKIYPFELRLRQSGLAAVGTLDTVWFFADVQAQIDPSGELVLTEARDSARPALVGTVTVAGRVRQGRHPPLAGDFQYERRGVFDPQGGWVFSQRGEIVSASRRPWTADDAQFYGSWRGYYVLTNCASTGWKKCFPTDMDQTWPLELTLSPTKTGVEGQLTLTNSRFSVSAAANARQLTLAGAGESIQSGGKVFHRLDAWDTRLDDLGRQRGPLRYTEEWRPERGEGYTLTYDAELWRVLRIQ